MDKIKSFLSASTAGLPNWAYLLIIGGVGALVFVIPKFRSSQGTQTSTDAGSTAGSTGSLAIDPTTGLPYSTSGYAPAGAYAGGVGDGQQMSSADFATLQAELDAIRAQLAAPPSGTSTRPPAPLPVRLPPAPQSPPNSGRLPPSTGGYLDPRFIGPAIQKPPMFHVSPSTSIAPGGL